MSFRKSKYEKYAHVHIFSVLKIYMVIFYQIASVVNETHNKNANKNSMHLKIIFKSILIFLIIKTVQWQLSAFKTSF